MTGISAKYFARILRAIQIGAHEYLQQVATNADDSVVGVDAPNFASLLQDLKRGTFHLSTNWIALPDEYLLPAANMPSTQTVSTRSGRGAATTTSAASAATTVSSLTQEATRESVVRVPNIVPDAEFAALTLRSGGTRAVFRAHRPPANDAGHEFCVAWWTRGGCYPNCGQRDTHRPFVSTAERARLLAYVREHLVKASAT